MSYALLQGYMLQTELVEGRPGVMLQVLILAELQSL